MNIYLREMRANLKALLIWCIGILFMIGGGLGKYAAMDEADKSVYQIMAGMPKPILALFGMVGLDISTASGFYAVIHVILLIMGTIYSAMLGAGIISKEERDKTSEFLFVKPASRVKIITAKILAALTNVLLFNVACLVFSIAVGVKVSQEEGFIRDIVALSLALLLVQILFLFIGTCMASITRKPAASANAATTVVMVTYLVSVSIDLSDKLEILKYFTPYKYFEARSIIHGGSPEPLFLHLSSALIIIFLAGTYLFFPKRDITI